MLAVVTLLCLMAMSHADPPACEELVRPVDDVDRHHLEGNWSLAASSNTTELGKFTGTESARANFANASGSSDMLFSRSFRINGNCKTMLSDITVEGSGFTLKERNLTVTFLHSPCPDCYVVRIDDDSKTLLRSHLFSRRRELEQKEMDEFRAQLECLNMPPPFVYDPKKELCPEKSADPTAQLEGTTKA